MVKKLDNPSNRIREWRIRRGVRQWQLAKTIGVKQNAISRIERGDRALSIHRFRQIAQALQVDIGQLLASEDNRMGLDSEGEALMRQLAERPELAPVLNCVVRAISAYPPGLVKPDRDNISPP